jgi:hypothetical protein
MLNAKKNQNIDQSESVIQSESISSTKFILLMRLPMCVLYSSSAANEEISTFITEFIDCDFLIKAPTEE